LGVHPREADRPRRQGDVPTYRPAPSIAWLRAVAIDAYTASGAVLALLIVLAAIDGDEVRALWLGLAALIIDGTDGMLARRFRVRAHLASFDGARMDDIVDYLTYVFAPIVLLHQGGYLPAGRPARWSPPCRCSRPATSSAARTPRPPTTCSEGSPATGTSWRSTP
jgi:hypothetical protein